jgi:hypothetical protein
VCGVVQAQLCVWPIVVLWCVLVPFHEQLDCCLPLATVTPGVVLTQVRGVG